MMAARLGVLISGRGSNLQAIIDAVTAGHLPATVAVVISNVPNVQGLDRAAAAGIPTQIIEHRGWTSRTDYERALVDALRGAGVDLVCLAGFMRLLSQEFIDAFPNAVLNIHPSLLPAFPGINAQRQALEHGVKVTGVTVHLVTAELDAGPIVMQTAVPVLDHDSVDTLSARVLDEEHRVYPAAIARVLAGGWRVEGRRFVSGAG